MQQINQHIVSHVSSVNQNLCFKCNRLSNTLCPMYRLWTKTYVLNATDWLTNTSPQPWCFIQPSLISFKWIAFKIVSPLFPFFLQGATSMLSFVPNDTWYDYYNGSRLLYTDRYVQLDAPLSTINVHVRGGIRHSAEDASCYHHTDVCSDKLN